MSEIENPWDFDEGLQPSDDDESWEDIKKQCGLRTCTRTAAPAPPPPPSPAPSVFTTACTHRPLNPISSDDEEEEEASAESDSDAGGDGPEALEEVLLLQVPNDVAAQFERLLREEPQGSQGVRVTFDEPTEGASQAARLRVGGEELPGRLCRLPTVVEVHKSFDGPSGTYYKANQIGQMLVVDRDAAALPTEAELPHGLSAPTARIRRRKWTRASQKHVAKGGGYTQAQMAALEDELAMYSVGKKAPPPHKELVWEDVLEGDEDEAEAEAEAERVCQSV